MTKLRVWLACAVLGTGVGLVATGQWQSALVFGMLAAGVVGTFSIRQLGKIEHQRARAKAALGQRFRRSSFDEMIGSAGFANGSLEFRVDQWIAAEKSKAD